MTALLGGARQLLTLSWRHNPLKLCVAGLLMLLSALIGPAMAVALRALTDSALAAHSTAVAGAAIAVSALAVAGLTLGHFAHLAYSEISEMNVLSLNQELIEVSNGSVLIDHHDSPGYADRITVLEQQVRELAMALQALLSIISLGAAITFSAIFLERVAPLLLLLPIFAVPPLAAGRRAEQWKDQTRSATAEQTRVALGFFRLATTSAPAKELRIYGLHDETLRRHREAWRIVTARQWQANIRATLVQALGQTIFVCGYIGAVLLVVRAAVEGRRTVGDVVLVITLAAQVNQQVAGAVGLLRDLQGMATAFRRMSEVHAQVTRTASRAFDLQPPKHLNQGIELADVSFAYPGSRTKALANITLSLPAGKTIAVVGENGAGKSSLVKLLCGMYQPTDGRILVDGEDLWRFTPTSWRERIAACFQDAVRFEFIARETIGVGDLRHIEDTEAVYRAAERAGATSILDRFEEGLATQLGKSHSDGVELSGGQWQKLALSRAFMRSGPLLLVLDEPAASLDPEAEYAMFTDYLTHARTVGEITGGITLFISHRLSTARVADIIVVMADGCIAEYGDHDSLVAAGGRYAELYALQVEAYR